MVRLGQVPPTMFESRSPGLCGPNCGGSLLYRPGLGSQHKVSSQFKYRASQNGLPLKYLKWKNARSCSMRTQFKAMSLINYKQKDTEIPEVLGTQCPEGVLPRLA